jgi:hypothetical protein
VVAVPLFVSTSTSTSTSAATFDHDRPTSRLLCATLGVCVACLWWASLRSNASLFSPDPSRRVTFGWPSCGQRRSSRRRGCSRRRSSRRRGCSRRRRACSTALVLPSARGCFLLACFPTAPTDVAGVLHSTRRTLQVLTSDNGGFVKNDNGGCQTMPYGGLPSEDSNHGTACYNGEVRGTRWTCSQGFARPTSATLQIHRRALGLGSSRFTNPLDVTPHHVTSHHVTSCHTTSRYITTTQLRVLRLPPSNPSVAWPLAWLIVRTIERKALPVTLPPLAGYHRLSAPADLLEGLPWVRMWAGWRQQLATPRWKVFWLRGWDQGQRLCVGGVLARRGPRHQAQHDGPRGRLVRHVWMFLTRVAGCRLARVRGANTALAARLHRKMSGACPNTASWGWGSVCHRLPQPTFERLLC